jgi:hypothetical protein
MLLMADRINMVEGIGQDVRRGFIPNIPAEMGLRSELRHNLPGFTRKVMISGAVLGLSVAAVRLISARRRKEQRSRASLPGPS